MLLVFYEYKDAWLCYSDYVTGEVFSVFYWSCGLLGERNLIRISNLGKRLDNWLGHPLSPLQEIISAGDAIISSTHPVWLIVPATWRKYCITLLLKRDKFNNFTLNFSQILANSSLERSQRNWDFEANLSTGWDYAWISISIVFDCGLHYVWSQF